MHKNYSRPPAGRRWWPTYVFAESSAFCSDAIAETLLRDVKGMLTCMTRDSMI